MNKSGADNKAAIEDSIRQELQDLFYSVSNNDNSHLPLSVCEDLAEESIKIFNRLSSPVQGISKEGDERSINFIRMLKEKKDKTPGNYFLDKEDIKIIEEAVSEYDSKKEFIDNLGENEYYDLSSLTEDQKTEFVQGFMKTVGKDFLRVFLGLDLKTHIEAMIIEDNTKKEFILSFRTVSEHLKTFPLSSMDIITRKTVKQQQNNTFL